MFVVLMETSHVTKFILDNIENGEPTDFIDESDFLLKYNFSLTSRKLCASIRNIFKCVLVKRLRKETDWTLKTQRFYHIKWVSSETKLNNELPEDSFFMDKDYKIGIKSSFTINGHNTTSEITLNENKWELLMLGNIYLFMYTYIASQSIKLHVHV